MRKTRNKIIYSSAFFWVGGLIIVGLALASTGCDYLEKRRIERTLEARTDAFSSGDLFSFMSFYSSDYNDGWPSFEECRTRVTSRFKKPPLPKLSFGKVEIELKDNGEQAVVSEHFVFEDLVEGRPMRYDDVHHLFLKRGPDGWTCYKGCEILRLMGGKMEEEYAVEQTLLRREAALVKKDIRAYMRLVSPDYKHKDKTSEQVKENLIRIFQLYDSIQIRTYDRKIWLFENYATVEQKFTMNTEKVGNPTTFSNQERFELEKAGDEWKFIKGL
jgi:hypothetical protein